MDSSKKTFLSSEFKTCLKNTKERPEISEMKNQAEYSIVSHNEVNSSEGNNITLKIFKWYTVKFYKPLLPLKFAFFFVFGTITMLNTYIPVFLKERGFLSPELALMYMISRAFKIMASIVSILIASRIKFHRTFLLVSLVLSIIIPSYLLFLPKLYSPDCPSKLLTLQCSNTSRPVALAKSSCSLKHTEVHVCRAACQVDHCTSDSFRCSEIKRTEREGWSFSLLGNQSFSTDDQCVFSLESAKQGNRNVSLCNSTLDESCPISCAAKYNEHCFEENQPRYLFVITNYICFVCLQFVFTIIYRILDIMLVETISVHSTSQYGREMFWARLGPFLLPAAAGYLVYLTNPADQVRYNNIIYFYMAASVVILCICLNFKFMSKPKEKKTLVKCFRLLKNPDVLSVIPVVLISGFSKAYASSFKRIYLLEFETPSYFFGLLEAASTLSALPVLVWAKWIIEKVGVRNVMAVALVMFSVYFYVYSVLVNPWVAFALDVIYSSSRTLLWITTVEYCRIIAPDGLYSTVESVSALLHFYVGHSLGALVGGMLIIKFNCKTAFEIMAFICCAAAALFILFLIIRRFCSLSTGRSYSKCDQRAVEPDAA